MLDFSVVLWSVLKKSYFGRWTIVDWACWALLARSLVEFQHHLPYMNREEIERGGGQFWETNRRESAARPKTGEEKEARLEAINRGRQGFAILVFSFPY